MGEAVSFTDIRALQIYEQAMVETNTLLEKACDAAAVQDAAKKRINELEAKLEAQPNDPDILYEVAEEYGLVPDIREKALRCYLRILSINPKNGKALFAIGLKFAQNPETYERAVWFLYKSLPLLSADERDLVHETLASTYRLLGDFKSYVQHLKKSSFETTAPAFMYQMAEVYSNAGKWPLAIRQCNILMSSLDQHKRCTGRINAEELNMFTEAGIMLVKCYNAQADVKSAFTALDMLTKHPLYDRRDAGIHQLIERYLSTLH